MVKKINLKYKPVVGLEVHIEQSTKSKMFCACSARHFGSKPNSQTCPVCLGLPGAMPYANDKAIENTVKLGFAFGSEIARKSKFDRKHYFYPDLPKGYQISQYDEPLCHNGNFQFSRRPGGQAISNFQRRIRVRRIHLEEDTAKLIHTKVDGEAVSLIDFNRSGVPLIELVTEPDFEDAQSVIDFLKEVQLIARYLEISDADMEKGSMRLEANVSLIQVKGKGQGVKELPDYKVELKNINSFRFLKKAINFEIERQSKLLKSGKRVTQETRGFDETGARTFSQRTKEEAQDYRYFPEPDLPEIRLSNGRLSQIKKTLPELPGLMRERFKKAYSLTSAYTDILVSDRARARYFEEALRSADGKLDITPQQLAGLIINQSFDKRFPEPAGLVRKVIELERRDRAPAGETREVIEEVIGANKKAIADYKKGKSQVTGYLMGQVQKRLSGRGDIKLIQKELLSKLRQFS